MIETARPADGDAILAITALIDIFSDLDKDCVRELWEDYVTRGIAASGYEFIVEREDNAVRGYLCFGPTPLTVNTWDMYWMAVHPQHRRKGIARALLAKAEERIGEQRGRLVLIETSGTEGYQGTRRCYESCGYRYQAVIHDFYAPHDDLIVFGKVLGGA
jgi:ribosomal protein S18 acetylase RimI-like enzyme